MLDFTSALYLGLQHPSGSAAPWQALTLGRPAALQEPPQAAAVACRLAALQGCEAATLLPSTLHLFWDLFGVLGQHDATICIETGTYPIARWGVQRGAALGVPVCEFAANDTAALERLAARIARDGRRPLIVCDAVRPGHDLQPPLALYAALAAKHAGCLVLDDTQGLGVLGPHGGGSLRQHGLASTHVIVGASLAKGFGVPMAVLSGSQALVGLFQRRSETRVHASPPSAAVIHAADHALTLNEHAGDLLRRRLVQRVRQFRRGLAQLRLRTAGGDFPVQSLMAAKGLDASAVYAGLLARRVRTVLHRDASAGRTRLSFILTAAQSAHCIDTAVDALAQTVRSMAFRSTDPVPQLEAR